MSQDNSGVDSSGERNQSKKFFASLINNLGSNKKVFKRETNR